MAVQLNLLPDVKQQYINAQQQRRLFTSVAVLIMGVSAALLVILFGYHLTQKQHLSSLNSQIASESQQLKGEPNINTILTVQNQLQSLTALHAGKPAVSRLFDSYLNAVTPASVAITDLNVDFTQSTATITGTADSLASVNQYVDALKKTTYTTSSDSTAAPAFSNVVLSSFGVNSNNTQPNQAASYTIDLGFDNTIFDITQANVNFQVPSITSRADVNAPTDLFQAAPAGTKTTNTGGH